MKLQLAGFGVMAIMATGCMDATRVNNTCHWSDAIARPLNLRARVDREHLRVDAEVANELMVRFGDVRYRNRPDMAEPLRRQCMSALLDSIVARHGVGRAAIARAEFDRVWWADAAFVFMPIALLGMIATDAATRRICAHFEPDDKAIATWAVIASPFIIALLTVGVANFWSFAVEGWRLRNGHVSNRASFLPIVAHGELAYVIALVSCTVVAAARFVRTPLTGGQPRRLSVWAAARK
jgi:hypothetical protein